MKSITDRFAPMGALSCVFACLLVVSPAHGVDFINYGDFDDFLNGGGIGYVSVTESTGTDTPPLYGEPDVVVNELDFDPKTFTADVSGLAPPDITDGQLNFGFYALPGAGVSSFLFNESGDLTLFGIGTDESEVAYSLRVDLTVLEVDGVAVSPFSLSATEAGSVDLTQVPDPGLGVEWALSVFLDLGPELLQRGFGPDALVTYGEVVINDTLTAISEERSLAFIAKKDFKAEPGGDLVPDAIPEPTTLALILAGVALAAPRRRS